MHVIGDTIKNRNRYLLVKKTANTLFTRILVVKDVINQIGGMSFWKWCISEVK